MKQKISNKLSEIARYKPHQQGKVFNLPNMSEVSAALLYQVGKQIIDLKEVDEKKMESFLSILESHVKTFETESITGMTIYEVGVSPLNEKDLVAVATLNQEFAQELSLQQPKAKPIKNYDFDFGM